MNLHYELLRYPVFSMREVSTLYPSKKTARAEKKMAEEYIAAMMKPTDPL